MVCAPVRRDNPRALARDYLSVQAHKPCSISGLLMLLLLKYNHLYTAFWIFVMSVKYSRGYEEDANTQT